MSNVGISSEDLTNKLIGCNFDGAAVMLGKQGRVAKKLKDKIGHVNCNGGYSLCCTQLGVLDVVKSVKYMSKFQDLDEIFYYFPKRG